MSSQRREELKKSRSLENARSHAERPKLSSRHSSSRVSSSDILSQPWGTTWRKAIVSLPRAVPDAVLRITSPDGPHPVVFKLPSRDKGRTIPIYVFIPPVVTGSRPSSPTHRSAPKKSSNLNPNSALTQKIKCPVVLDFHGGGFILGSCQEQSPFCAKLSRDLSCIAISVDYRLGPYAKFPAALHDAEDVLNAILDPASPAYKVLRDSINTHLSKASRPHVELDTGKLALSGFSSGGSLALNLAMSLPTQVSKPANANIDIPQPWPSPFPKTYSSTIPLLLYYPALDTRLLPHERPLPPGMEAPKSFWSSLNLEGQLMPTYLPKDLTSHPRASPGLVNTSYEADILHRQAKALIILPERDTLSASNELWVKRMVEEGRESDLAIERVKGMLHGWTQFPDSWLDEDARAKKNRIFDRTVRFVKDAWDGRVDDTVTDSDTDQVEKGVVDFEGKPKDLRSVEAQWVNKAAV